MKRGLFILGSVILGSATNCYADLNENQIINEVAVHYNVEPEMVKAIGKVESNHNKDAVSHAGAIGYMQVMPATAKSFCGLEKNELTDLMKNITCGTSYFAHMQGKFQSPIKALAAYNAGPGSSSTKAGLLHRLETKGDDWYSSMPEETRKYISKVMDEYYLYKYFGLDKNKEIVIASKDPVKIITPDGNIEPISSPKGIKTAKEEYEEILVSFRNNDVNGNIIGADYSKGNQKYTSNFRINDQDTGAKLGYYSGRDDFDYDLAIGYNVATKKYLTDEDFSVVDLGVGAKYNEFDLRLGFTSEVENSINLGFSKEKYYGKTEIFTGGDFRQMVGMNHKNMFHELYLFNDPSTTENLIYSGGIFKYFSKNKLYLKLDLYDQSPEEAIGVERSFDDYKANLEVHLDKDNNARLNVGFTVKTF
ncbi:lytic transglycosylase domain-containing protein [Nanoarchaeota archaeon]